MATTSNRPNWVWRFIIGAVVLLVVGGAAFLGILLTGQVAGAEFSPQTFMQRNFWYYRLPFVHLRVTGTHYDSMMGSKVAEADVVKNLTTGATSAGVIRWDLCEYVIGGTPQTPGEAKILTLILRESNDQDENVWNEWTKENAVLAKLLWPEVQQFAIHDCYFAIPELMEQASAKPTESELKARIFKIAQAAALDKSKQLRAQGDDARAAEIASWGLSYGDDSALREIQSSIQSSSSAP